MRIHVGCELRFEFPQTTPMILTLNVHSSRVSELVLSLPDRAARYRACLAVRAIEKSHRGADGSSTTRGNKTALPRELPWPYEFIRSKEPRLRRPALNERDRAHAWFGLRGNDRDDSHLVRTLK